jgi:hypothetical protein
MSDPLALLMADLSRRPGGRTVEQALRKVVTMMAPLLYAQTMRGQDSPEIPGYLQQFAQARHQAEALVPTLKQHLPPSDRQAVILLSRAMITK